MMRFILPLMSVLAFALCCTVSQEPMSTTPTPKELRFDVLDGLNDDFMGMDTVEVRLSSKEGLSDSAEVFIYYSTNGGVPPFASTSLTHQGDGLFRSEILCEPYQTKWYIGARDLGVTTAFGSVDAPQIAEKYLLKGYADNLIADQMNTLLSGLKFQTYFPRPPETSYSYTHHTIVGQTVILDHYIDNFNVDGLHKTYGVEYNTNLDQNKKPIQGEITPNYQVLSQGIDQDFGYVIIASTDTLGLQEILKNPNFFPPTENSFIEVIHY